MFALDCWKNKVEIDQNKFLGTTKVTLPARFDFIGGWTDTPPYFFNNDACVLNSTLDLIINGDTQKLSNIMDVQVDYSSETTIRENNIQLKGLDDNLIIKQCFDFLKLKDPKISIAISNWIPKGSGLGGSSLFTASILSALWVYYKGIDFIGNHLNELVNNVLLIEQLLKSGGGWQDQIGGIFPGLKLIAMNHETKCSYSISYLENNINNLNKISLIIDSGIHRKAINILHSIRQKYLDQDPETIKTLKTIAHNAKLGFDLLQRGDLVSFAQVLSESWKLVNAVERSTVEFCDMIKKICRNDLIGLKIGGAGGGGFILTMFQNEEKQRYYKQIIQKYFPESFIYNPLFGGHGLSVYQNIHSQSDKSRFYQVDKINLLKCESHTSVTRI